MDLANWSHTELSGRHQTGLRQDILHQAAKVPPKKVNLTHPKYLMLWLVSSWKSETNALILEKFSGIFCLRCYRWLEAPRLMCEQWLARHFKTENPLARTDFIQNCRKARSYKDLEGTIAASSSVQQTPVFKRLRFLNSNEETKDISTIRNVFRCFNSHLTWMNRWCRTGIPAMCSARV